MTGLGSAPQRSVFVVIDVGCHECGVDSVPVGIFPTRDLAEAAEQATREATGGWRDGGQTICEVYEMTACEAGDECG